MAVNAIPEKIVNFNVYDNAEKLVGITAEVTLPNFESMTSTVSGAGLAGEYEAPTPGHFGSLEMEIPFRVLIDKTFSILNNGQKTITLRAAQQSNDIADGKIKHSGLKITVRGNGKGVNLGKIAVGQPMDSSNKLEVLYIKIEKDGATLIEYDKVNFIFVVNGKDLLQEIRNSI